MGLLQLDEREVHNAQIKERYRQLQNAVADQFATSTETNYQPVSNYAPTAPAYAPIASSTPVMEQEPVVTEYVRTMDNSALFSAEKFDRVRSFEREEVTTAHIEPTLVADVTNEMTTQVVDCYSLSPLAKLVMAVFAVVVVAMMTLICVNTYKIQQKNIRLQNLEEKREELMEKNEELQRRIEEARSEKTIREYAESQGMIQIGD